MYVTAYNSTDRPLLADDEGRQIGGLSFGSVDENCESVKLAVSNNDIKFVNGITDDSDSGAIAADQLTRQRNGASDSTPEIASRKTKQGDK